MGTIYIGPQRMHNIYTTLTLLQRFFASVLNGLEFLLFSTGLCAPLGNRTTALNDFIGEPFQTKKEE